MGEVELLLVLERTARGWAQGEKSGLRANPLKNVQQGLKPH